MSIVIKSADSDTQVLEDAVRHIMARDYETALLKLGILLGRLEGKDKLGTGAEMPLPATETYTEVSEPSESPKTSQSGGFDYLFEFDLEGVRDVETLLASIRAQGFRKSRVRPAPPDYESYDYRLLLYLNPDDDLRTLTPYFRPLLKGDVVYGCVLDSEGIVWYEKLMGAA